MVEGELKKRIKAHEVTTLEESIRTLFPLDVYSVIDEARKEFPTLEQARAQLETQMTLLRGSIDSAYFLVSTLRDMQIKWFLKWFGNEKEA